MSRAHEFSLDLPNYLSIEYPLIVRNNPDSINKAINLIGGPNEIVNSFIDDNHLISLNLRPQDPYSHPITSYSSSTENILLKFSVPKRILKKNKGNLRLSIEECKSNGIKYKCEPVGILAKNFRFRRLVDFQRVTVNSKFTSEFKDSILKNDLDNIKQFADSIGKDQQVKDLSRVENLDIPPLLRYTRVNIPYLYNYNGNLSLVENLENGKHLIKHKKLYTIFRAWNDKTPMKFDSNLQVHLDASHKEIEQLKAKKLERLIPMSQGYALLQCIKILKKLFEMKPIWLRRHIYWMTPVELRTTLRIALPYVAYCMQKGPWRQSFIRIGYDPKKDRENGWRYQVEAFRTGIKTSNNFEIQSMLDSKQEQLVIPISLKVYEHEFDDPNSEINQLGILKLPRQLIYNGVNLSTSVAYQIDDLMDPDIYKLLQDDFLMSNVSILSGWLKGFVVLKVRAIIRYKLNCISKNNLPFESKKIDDILQKESFPLNEAKKFMSREELESRNMPFEGEDYEQEEEEEIEEEDDDEEDIDDDDDDDDDGEGQINDGLDDGTDAIGSSITKNTAAASTTAAADSGSALDLDSLKTDLFERLGKFNSELMDKNQLNELKGFLHFNDVIHPTEEK